jgi:hypothetical protein
MAAGKFVKAAAQLIRILGEDRCAIAGGMAVNAHGFVRGTRDVDVIVAMPLAEARRLLSESGVTARLFKGDVVDGDFPCLKGVIPVGSRPADAVPFDVLPTLVPLEPERFVDLLVRGQRLRVVDPDTLIRLKLKAGSSHDLYDVAILANLHPDWMEHALALAVSHGREMGERLANLIREPRVRGQAKEVQRQDRALQAFARRAAAKRTPGSDSGT